MKYRIDWMTDGYDDLEPYFPEADLTLEQVTALVLVMIASEQAPKTAAQFGVYLIED